MNFRKIESFNVIKRIPKFYQQVFTSYKSCKRIKPINKMTKIEMLSQPIWGNEYFKSKDKCLFLENWLKSGFIHVKDLFDTNGNFITEEALQEKLKDKHNWISEFYILKNVVYKNIRKHFDTSVCPYIQQSCIRNISFNSVSSRVDPKCFATKDWYTILINKKAKKNIYTKYVAEETASEDPRM